MVCVKAIKAPKVRMRKKGDREYWAADWRKDGKSVTRHIGAVMSMSQDEANEIALQKKIKDLSAKNLQTSDFVFQREEETQKSRHL